MPQAARVLLYDTETAPSLGWVWGKWQTDVIEFERDWHLLSFSYKWLDEKQIRTRALPDYRGYAKNRECDKKLTADLWDLFDQADIVIGHNVDRFDVRKTNARFLTHGLKPPSPYKTIDTLKIARRHFKFDSNRLDDLGRYLNVGRKLPHTGKALWLACMRGDRAAWATMRKYNAQDVALLERIYLKLRPWAANHPNLTFFTREDGCPVCQSHRTQSKGWAYRRTGKRQRWVCADCGHRWDDGRLIRDAA